MNIVKILGKSGRMELADLASLLLPTSVGRKEKNEPDCDEFGEDCEECEEDDEDECVVCMLRNILHSADQNVKTSNEDMHSRRRKTGNGWQVFPFRFWAKFTTSRGVVEQ